MFKQIDLYEFRYIGPIRPQTEADGTIKTFLPQTAFTKRPDLALHAYGTGPFCKFVIPKNLRESGVYAFTIADEIMYIGECVRFDSRFNVGYGQISPRNCYNGGQPTNCRINNLVYQSAQAGKQVDLWFIATPNYKIIEANLISLLKPVWNRTIHRS